MEGFLIFFGIVSIPIFLIFFILFIIYLLNFLKNGSNFYKKAYNYLDLLDDLCYKFNSNDRKWFLTFYYFLLYNLFVVGRFVLTFNNLCILNY